MAQQINKELLEEWERKGELLMIWQCEKCFRKIPFYKSENELINALYLWWGHDHKFCDKCIKKLNPLPKQEENFEDKRVKYLLETYGLEEEWNIQKS